MVECRLAKADGAGSTPVSCSNACIAQQVEHILGTDEVMRSSRIASSIWAGNSEVEWRTENPFVGGSIPPWPTISIMRVWRNWQTRSVEGAMVVTLYRFESYYTHHFMSLWRNRQTRTAQTRFSMGSTPIRLTIL